MGELVAEAFLTVAFEKLFELLASPEFRSFFHGKKSIDGQLGLLNEKLKTASLLLNDAENRQITDEKVKEWHDDLKDVIFRADDLVEEIKAEARSKQELESGTTTRGLNRWMAFLTPLTKFDKTVRGEIENILKALGFLLERASTLRLNHTEGAQNTRSLQRSPAPFLEESHVHGRDIEKEEILNMLLSDEIWGNKIGVLPIVGMGGLGKTTLARLVYEDDRVKKADFQPKAWVTVSTDFDIFRITKVILQQAGDQTTSNIEELTELQGRLKDALRGKKFLFVLDDVWDENYGNWDALKSAFMSGDCRSRILITTRSETVACNVKTANEVHRLQIVSSKDCWNIFVDHAFNGNSIIDPRLQEIGEKIVEKCKGLPLAVRSLGGLLRSERNPEVWESILWNHVWSKNLRNNILPGLWLSYSCLPSSVKQCFAYCSIFPKGYEFEKKKIILLWMAEGFLHSDQKGKRMEEVGNECFDELMVRSILQRSSRNKSKYSMHDLVHDLAMFVSGEVCFRFDDATNVEQLGKKTRYMSIERMPKDHELWKVRFDAKNLRSFLKLTYGKYELVKEVVEGERCLRVLSLPAVSITELQMLHDSFSKLKHLRYLDLSGSGIEEIPCSICNLYNLQTLLLEHCEKLTRLPKDLGRLINLRHLNIWGTSLKEMPPQMGKLKELQTLTNFVLGQSDTGSSIEELGALQHLAGKLHISGLQNIVDVGGVRKANYLMDKEKLSELDLKWEGEVTDTIRARDTLNVLQPHTNLTKLIIYGYAGSNFPNWLGDSSFSNIVSVEISGNEYCLFLPPLGQLPSLQNLVIESFHGVEKIGDEFYGAGHISSITPFQSLQILKFFGLQSWKEWSFIDRDGKQTQCFPCLKELCINGCPNLARSLPDCVTIETLMISNSMKSTESLPLNHFSKLKHLHLQRIENLKELIVESPNVIETLNIRECNKLEFSGGHCYEHIKELRIYEGWASLKSFPLDYFPRLDVLELTRCQNLESLTFTEENGTAIKSPISKLSIRDCKNFRSLPEHTHKLLPSLAVMELFDCPEIESFAKGGLPPNLNKLKISKCCKLVAQHRYWDVQGLTCLRSLEIRHCEDIMLDSFPEGWSIPSSLTSFILWNLPCLKSLNGSAFKKAESLAELSIRYCTELQFLPDEILSLPSLRCLEIMRCPFLERRYRRGKGEDWHKVSQLQALCILGKTTRYYEVKSAFANF